VKKTVRWGLSSLLTAGALGAALVQAPAASAVEGFVCPAGSDTIPVPFAWTASGVPILAGTVCVFTGTTAYRLVDMSAGWRVEVKSLFGSTTTDVRFYNPTTNGKVELIYTQLGRIQIKI
jgi:alpha-D-ribose 1-methylphosphonate 5-phosphate C-P lyase